MPLIPQPPFGPAQDRLLPQGEKGSKSRRNFSPLPRLGEGPGVRATGPGMRAINAKQPQTLDNPCFVMLA